MKRLAEELSEEKGAMAPITRESGTYLRVAPAASPSVPPVSLPNANRARQMIAAGIEELVRVEVFKGQAAAEWVDQGSSPLGRRRHLELVRNGVLPGTRSGKLVLVRRCDLDEYLAAHATLPSVPSSADEEAAVAALLSELQKQERT